MKINLSKTITKLDGELIADKSAGWILANYLMEISTKKGTALRLFPICIELLEDKEIELTKDDFELIVMLVDEGNMDNIMKAKILIELNGG